MVSKSKVYFVIYLIIPLLISLGLIGCKSKKVISENIIQESLLVANLESGKSEGFEMIKEKFEARNQGYGIDFVHQTNLIKGEGKQRTVFIQNGGGTAVIDQQSSKFSVGDILMLRAQEEIRSDSLFSALVISVPNQIPSELPKFIRPDWDENITDKPGGCATETNAYRRILLTWKNSVGPYVFHSINAHRVRIMDSFSHYHPKVGGFDEFYLVQMAAPTARMITSTRVNEIERSDKLTKEKTSYLTQSHTLKVGDLVYLPRGLMHRGVGNVLAQVITVPGFIPGAEIGVDHHLWRINQRLKLSDDKALPYNKEASKKAIIK